MPEDFEKLVEEYRQCMLLHRFTVGVSAPYAPPIIADCIKRVNQGKGKPDDFVADYEIIDDTPPPPPEPTFEVKKLKLRAEVSSAERSAIDAIMPPGKRQLLALKVRMITRLPADQTEEEKKLISIYASTDFEISAIQFRAAEMQVEIDHLTEAEIDQWQVKPFK